MDMGGDPNAGDWGDDWAGEDPMGQGGDPLGQDGDPNAGGWGEEDPQGQGGDPMDLGGDPNTGGDPNAGAGGG